MLSLPVINDDFITVRMELKQLGNQRVRYERNLCIGECFPDRAEGRSRHHGITDPVGRPHHDAVNICLTQFFQIRYQAADLGMFSVTSSSRVASGVKSSKTISTPT